MKELKALVYEGVTEFVAVMDRGIGLLAANAVLTLKQENPGLRLTCLLLWEEQAADWPEPVREIWFNTISLCDREVMLERHRSGSGINMKKIWSVYCFLEWYDVYFGAHAA